MILRTHVISLNTQENPYTYSAKAHDKSVTTSSKAKCKYRHGKPDIILLG